MTTTDTPSRSVQEARARARAATRIALVLHRLGVDSDTAGRLDDAGRRAVAALAGVRSPSGTTWAVVVGVLDELAEDEQ